MRLSIIILSYNTRDLTTLCINSIIKQHKREIIEGEFEIIIVDNASSDDSVEKIKPFTKDYKNIQLIENKKNEGFAKGCNIASLGANAKYLFFLNSDTLLNDSGLNLMLKFLDKNENIGILGARLLNDKGGLELSAGKFLSLINIFFFLLGFERLGIVRFSPKTIKQVDWVSGGSMMVKKDLFEVLHGFDEDFFMYMEDMDFCFRARKKGILTYFFPSIDITHKAHGSSSRTFAIIQIYKGILNFYKKHNSPIEYGIVKILLMIKAVVLFCVGVITGSEYLKKTYSKALELI